MVVKRLRLPGVQMNGKNDFKKVSIERMKDLGLGKDPFFCRIIWTRFGIGISKSENFKTQIR